MQASQSEHAFYWGVFFAASFPGLIRCSLVHIQYTVEPLQIGPCMLIIWRHLYFRSFQYRSGKHGNVYLACWAWWGCIFGPLHCYTMVGKASLMSKSANVMLVLWIHVYQQWCTTLQASTLSSELGTVQVEWSTCLQGVICTYFI